MPSAAGLPALLSRSSLRATAHPVLVLESTRCPHHKVCGEFLSEEAQALLAYLGLDVRTMGASSMGMFRLAAGASYAEAQLPFRAAGYSRYRLDQACWSRRKPPAQRSGGA